MLKNSKYQSNQFLLKEEERLIILMDRLKGYSFMRNDRARAGNNLACIQAELSRRGRCKSL